MASLLRPRVSNENMRGVAKRTNKANRNPLTNITNLKAKSSTKKGPEVVSPQPPKPVAVQQTPPQNVMEVEDDLLDFLEEDCETLVEDIDQSFDDAQAVSEYAQEIYEYSLQKEVSSLFQFVNLIFDSNSIVFLINTWQLTQISTRRCEQSLLTGK